MLEINTNILAKYLAKKRVWVPPTMKTKGYYRMQETGTDVDVGPKDWDPTPEEIEDQLYGFSVKVPSDPKKEWRNKPEGYFSCDKAFPLTVKYNPDMHAEASVSGPKDDITISLSDKFFKLDKEIQDRIMAHETGHTFEDQISNMEKELLDGVASKVLGTMVLRPGKVPYYDGVWGEMEPSEAFAESVTVLYHNPEEFKEKYPEAYDFMISVMPSNWKEVIKANIDAISRVKNDRNKS